MGLYGRGLQELIRGRPTDDAEAAARNLAEVLTMARQYMGAKEP